MSMANELILRNDNVDFLQPMEQQMLIGMLMDRLMRELAGTPLERYAEAASLLLKFDQELLQTIIGEPVTTDRFREFCDMPVVVRRRNGWALHDAVREWIAADFQNRKPSDCQETKKNALAALKARSDRQPALQTEIGFELIFLHDSPFIRSFCFQLDNQLDLRPVRKADLTRMEWLYLAHMRAISGADPADPHLAPLIRPLWNLHPEAFLGLWQDQMLVAFIACHRLDDRVKAVLLEHPVTRPAASRLPTDETAYVMCLYGVEPEFLGIPVPSYFRYLKSGIRRFACEWTHEG